MSLQEPLLAAEEPATESRSTRKYGGWMRLSIVAVAGFLGPIVVLFLGARIKGCPPPDCSACTTGRISAPPQNTTAEAVLLLPIPYAHQADLTEGAGLHHAVDPALSKFADPAWLSSAAARLRGAWGLDSLVFLRTAGTAHLTVDSVTQDASAYGRAIVVAIVQGPRPVRRASRQPFMAMSSARNSALSGLIPLKAINSGAGVLESALGRRLFPIRLEVAAIGGKPSPQSPPFAVFDVSSGRLVLEAAVVSNMGSLTHLPDAVAAFAHSLFSQMSRFSSVAEGHSLGQAAQVAVSAAASAVTAAIAYQVPLWFCIACPVVLGGLAPFVINGGLAALTDAACRHWALPPQECNDLWYGAFAAGMILSLASAIPIVFICKLPQCAHRKPG